MKKIILIASLIFIGCSNDDVVDRCKTITFKESRYEWVSGNTYAPAFYLYLDGEKTKVTKSVYENNNTGGEICNGSVKF